MHSKDVYETEYCFFVLHFHWVKGLGRSTFVTLYLKIKKKTGKKYVHHLKLLMDFISFEASSL